MSHRVVVIVLDGEHPAPSPGQHPDITVIRLSDVNAKASQAPHVCAARSSVEQFLETIQRPSGSDQERVQEAAPVPASNLSARERQVLGHIASGLTHSQTAKRMMLSKATVNTYVERIKRKVEAGNKADLTRAAFRLGLVHHTPA